jgi:multidrug resistance efflux pump
MKRNGQVGAPFIQRQKKRLEVGDDVKLSSYNEKGDQVVYSGRVTAVAPDGRSLTAIVRTDEGLVEMTLNLPDA